MKKCPLIIGLILQCHFLLAAPDYNLFYPAATMQIINSGESSFHKEIDMRSVEDLIEGYKQTKGAWNSVSGVASTTGNAINEVIDALPISPLLGDNFIHTLGAKIISNVAKGSVNSVVSKIEEKAKEATTNVLLMAIDKTYNIKNNAFYDATPEVQFKMLLDTVKNEDKVIAEVIKDDIDNAIFQSYGIQATRSEVIQSAIRNLMYHRENQNSFDLLHKDSMNLSEQVRRKLELDTKKVLSLGKAILNIEGKRLQDQVAITEIQSKILDTLKTALPNKNSEQSREAEKKAQVELAQTVDMAYQTGHSAITIARNLGINDPIIDQVDKGLTVAKAGASIILGAMTTPVGVVGIVGGIASLTGVFCKQGPDVSSIRHQEIMSNLRAIREQIAQGNETILKGLNQIDKNIKILGHNIKIIDSKINDISLKIDQVNYGINDIKQSLAGLHQQIKNGIFQDYINCSDHLISKIKVAKSFKSLKDELHFTEKNNVISNDINKCIEGFRMIFSHTKPSDYFQDFVNIPKESKYFYKSSVEKIVGVLSKLNAEIEMSKLKIPNNEYWALKVKKGSSIAKIADDYSENVAYLSKPLNPNVVSNVVEDYLYFYPLTYMFSQEKGSNYCRYIPPQEMNEIKNSEFPGDSLATLKDALSLVQMAIAQQTLEIGDLAIYPIITAIKNQNKKILPTIEDVLSENKIFGHNLLVVFINDFIMQNNPRDEWYNLAIHSPHTKELLDTLNLPFEIDFEKINGIDNAYIKVHNSKNEKVKIFFPTVEEINSGRLKISKRLKRLLVIRNRLIDAIVDIRFMQQTIMSKDNRLMNAYRSIL